MSETLRVGYQGEPGAFSEAAIKRLLGANYEGVPHRSFEEMFESVRHGVTDCCVAPIENSLAGSIHRNYDLLLESDLAVLGETNLRVVHNLIVPPQTSMTQIQRVYSHPVALAQCERFLRANPNMESIPVHDTAGAVRLVMERHSGDEAAIASERAADIHKATILARGIEDHANNFTRFFLAAPRSTQITPASEVQPRRWKTSLVLTIANKPGTLFRALGAFAMQEIDVSKIESRPIQGRPWEYAFYLDVIGNAHAVRDPLTRALETLRSMADTVTILGSYPTRW